MTYDDILEVELAPYCFPSCGEPVSRITYETTQGEFVYRYMATDYHEMIGDTLAKMGMQGDEWLCAYEQVCELLEVEPYPEDEDEVDA
jgi:hypothetical protein